MNWIELNWIELNYETIHCLNINIWLVRQKNLKKRKNQIDFLFYYWVLNGPLTQLHCPLYRPKQQLQPEHQ